SGSGTKDAWRALERHCRSVARSGESESAKSRLEAGTLCSCDARCSVVVGTDPCQRRLAGAGGASADRHHCRSDRQSDCSCGTCTGRVQAWQARCHGDSGGRRDVRAVACAPRQRSRCGLQPGVRRSAGAYLRPCRFGVFVVFEGDTEYIRNCFKEYMVRTDTSGRYACLYKRWHLIGLEVGISVASVGLRGEPTGCPTGFRADVVATAKRNLNAGEILDGEGGYTVVGRLMPAAESMAQGCL